MTLHRKFTLLVLAGVTGVSFGIAGAAYASNQEVITSAGPMTNVYLSDDLSCQAQMANDPTPAFAGGTAPGACGTFLQVAGGDRAIAGGAPILFGPDLSAAGGTATVSDDFVPVGAQTLAGSGTSSDPYVVTTTVQACAPGTGLAQGACPSGEVEVALLTETDSYAVGSDQYNTSLAIDNEAGFAISGTLYHAGACNLNGGPSYGAVGGPGGNAPACSLTPGGSPAGRITTFVPAAGRVSNYFEGANVWSDVTPAGAPYPDTTDTTTLQSNGIGLSWPYSLAPGATTTISYDTAVTPNTPPSNTALPAISGSPAPGQLLSCSQGSWTSTTSISYAYQWLQDGSPISGATGSAYSVQNGDTGHSLSCQVTASTIDGVAIATSAGEMVPTPVAVPNVPGAPTVSAGPPTVTTGGAAFSATVNPNGSTTTVYFEYGLDPKYGLTTASNLYVARTTSQTLPAGSTAQPVTATVAGLVPNALYHFRVVASNAQGNATSVDKTFTTQALPAPPAPVLGKQANFAPVSGTVYVKPPPATHAGLQANLTSLTTSGLTKGAGFVPLTEPRQLPVGTEVDARAGTLTLITAITPSRKGKRTKTESGHFSLGLFKVLQSAKQAQKGLTTLQLLDNGIFPGAPSYAAECTAVTKTTNNSLVFRHRGLSKRVLQSLAGNEHGKYQTKGKYSAATVRGTIFTVTDRCDGTVTAVKRGEVSVTAYSHPRTPIVLRAGQSYLAKAP